MIGLILDVDELKLEALEELNADPKNVQTHRRARRE